MRLQDMTIGEKITALEELFNKAMNDPEYASQVNWLDDKDSLIPQLQIEIENVKYLDKEIENADGQDIKSAIYAHHNMMLDAYLKLFPEYANNEIITESVGPTL